VRTRWLTAAAVAYVGVVAWAAVESFPLILAGSGDGFEIGPLFLLGFPSAILLMPVELLLSLLLPDVVLPRLIAGWLLAGCAGNLYWAYLIFRRPREHPQHDTLPHPLHP
jgi:hypothetical protein